MSRTEAEIAAYNAEKVARLAEETAAAPEKPVASTPARAASSRAFQEAFGNGIDTPKPIKASVIANVPPAALSEVENSIKTIARAGSKSPEAGEQALRNALKSNPKLMAEFGARFTKDGKLQSLGNLDLDGDGKRSSLEDKAIAAAITDMQANRSYADIAQALDTKGFRERTTLELNALIASEYHKKPQTTSTEVAEVSCPRVPLRIIPCPKGGKSH